MKEACLCLMTLYYDDDKRKEKGVENDVEKWD